MVIVFYQKKKIYFTNKEQKKSCVIGPKCTQEGNVWFHVLLTNGKRGELSVLLLSH